MPAPAPVEATSSGRHRAHPMAAPEPECGPRHRAASRSLPIPAAAGAAVLAMVAAGGVAVAAGPLAGPDTSGTALTNVAVPALLPAAPERVTRSDPRPALSPKQAAKARSRAQALLDARLAAAAAARLAALQGACGYNPRAQQPAALTPHMQANARTIVEVSRRMNLPPRAAVIALATALQESHLRNTSGGHLDSAGLFQQRPSAGWGTYGQVTNPEYSARKFYSELLKVPGWRSLPLTVAAQDVQVSAFPWAYARWEGAAASIVSRILRVPVDSLNCRPR